VLGSGTVGGVINTTVTDAVSLSSSYSFGVGYRQGVCNPNSYFTGAPTVPAVWF